MEHEKCLPLILKKRLKYGRVDDLSFGASAGLTDAILSSDRAAKGGLDVFVDDLRSRRRM
jgi:hypothetical protein